jgi:hypothetical protein
MRPLEPFCPGEARSRFKKNKYNLKKRGDYTVSEGHGYPLVYNILGVCLSGCDRPPWVVCWWGALVGMCNLGEG